MLSVALLICIVWKLGHRDINFRSFKEEKNKRVIVDATVPHCYSTYCGLLYYPLPRPLGAIHSFSYSGEKKKRGEKRERRKGKGRLGPRVLPPPVVIRGGRSSSREKYG